MKPLTPQQEKFAQLVAEGKGQSEAHKVAYPKSINWKPSTTSESASRLMANSNVSARVAELRSKAQAKTVITLESHLAELERLRDLALENGKFDAAINAEVHRGKAKGLYVSKTEDVTDPMRKALGRMKPEQLENVIESLDKVKAIREKAKSAA